MGMCNNRAPWNCLGKFGSNIMTRKSETLDKHSAAEVQDSTRSFLQLISLGLLTSYEEPEKYETNSLLSFFDGILHSFASPLASSVPQTLYLKNKRAEAVRKGA